MENITLQKFIILYNFLYVCIYVSFTKSQIKFVVRTKVLAITHPQQRAITYNTCCYSNFISCMTLMQIVQDISRIANNFQKTVSILTNYVSDDGIFCAKLFN